MKHQAGFTLIELLTVIAITGILATFATPNLLGRLSLYRLKASTADLSSALQHARLRAVKENADVVVLFDPDKNGQLEGNYIIFIDNGAGSLDTDRNGVLDKANNWTWDMQEKLITKGELQAGIKMTKAAFGFGRPRTRFNSRGLPSFVGTVILMNNRQDSRSIILSAVGNTRVQ